MSTDPNHPDAPEGFRFLDGPEEVPELPDHGSGPEAGSAGGLSLELDGDRTAYRPGEEMEGTVSWELPSGPETRPPESIEVRLFWYTEGRGDRDVGIVQTETVEAVGPRGDHRFEFRLPEGPYSFSGPLISLIWALEAVTEPDLRTTRREIVVAPEGREVRLRSLEEDQEADDGPGDDGPEGGEREGEAPGWGS